MVLRLLAFNAEAWLAEHFNAYLVDGERVPGDLASSNSTRWAGRLFGHRDPRHLDRPDRPRVARALELLDEELNATPACLPG